MKTEMLYSHSLRISLLILVCLFLVKIAAPQRISDLPPATYIGTGDLTPVVQNGVTKKLPFASLIGSLGCFSDSIYVKYQCYKIKGKTKWYSMGDTIYIDTCQIFFDPSASEIPITISSANYTSKTGSEAVAFIDLSNRNDTLFLGSAATRENDMIYVARTDLFGNSVVIMGSPGIYYRSQGFTTYWLSKSMSGAILQSDGTAWYIIGIFFDNFSTPTKEVFRDSTAFSSNVEFMSSIHAVNLDSAKTSCQLFYNSSTGEFSYGSIPVIIAADSCLWRKINDTVSPKTNYVEITNFHPTYEYYQGSNGDVNLSGTFTATDVLWISQYLAGMITYNSYPNQVMRMDVDGDGFITMTDKDLLTGSFSLYYPNIFTNFDLFKRTIGNYHSGLDQYADFRIRRPLSMNYLSECDYWSNTHLLIAQPSLDSIPDHWDIRRIPLSSVLGSDSSLYADSSGYSYSSAYSDTAGYSFDSERLNGHPGSYYFDNLGNHEAIQDLVLKNNDVEMVDTLHAHAITLSSTYNYLTPYGRLNIDGNAIIKGIVKNDSLYTTTGANIERLWLKNLSILPGDMTNDSVLVIKNGLIKGIRHNSSGGWTGIASSALDMKGFSIRDIDTIYAGHMNINGTMITASAAEINVLRGMTATTQELNILDGLKSTTAELNILTGLTTTTDQLNYLSSTVGTTGLVTTKLVFSSNASLQSPSISGGWSSIGGQISLNASSNYAVNIASGTSTGTVTIGGTAAQIINLGSTGTKTVTIGDNSGSVSGSCLIGGSTTTNGGFNYCADAGITDTYAASLSPAPTALTIGMIVFFNPNTSNTTDATFNLNALGAKTIAKRGMIGLSTNDIQLHRICIFIYDGSVWQYLNPVTE